MATRKSNKTAHVLSLITNNKAADLPPETKETSVSDISNQIPTQAAPNFSNQALVPSASKLPNQVPVSPAPEISNQVPVSPAPEISNQVPVSPAPEISNQVPVSSVPEISNQVPVSSASEISNQVPVSPAPEISNQVPVSPAPEISNQVPVSPAPEISNQVPVSSAPKISNQVPVLQMPITPNQSPAPQQGTLPILEISSKGNDPVSDIIKEKLLEELGETIEKEPALNNTKQTTTETLSNLLSKASNETIQSKAEILKKSVSNNNSSSEVTPFEPFNFDESRENKEAMSINENLPNDVTNNESTKNQNDNSKFIEENNPSLGINDEHHISDKSYCYVNVMEKIVKDKVESFMKQFNMCTCSRCIADTMALTLTNLQPKYIVTSQENYFPLLNYYGNKFFASVTAELMKACMMVHENPHHENNER